MTSTANGKVGVVMIVQSLPPQPSGGAELQALKLAAALKTHPIDPWFLCPGQAGCKGRSEIEGMPVWRLHSPLNYLLDVLFMVQRRVPKPKTVIEYDDRAGTHNAITRKIGWGARLRYNIFLINAYFFLRKRTAAFAIIHSHTIEWPGYVAAMLSKWLNKKLVVKDSTMNGITNILRFPQGAVKQRLIMEQAQFVAMTASIEGSLLQAGVSASKIARIPNGIYTGGERKQHYESGQTVLFVGNLYQQPAKGVDILLKSWKLVSASSRSSRLLIAGDGDIRAYETYTQSLGIGNSVTFLGKQSAVTQLMLNADVFVLPSRREGMPNVLMEAMLRALPCVATNISGSQDLIEPGYNGFLVPSADEQALAAAILELLNDRKLAERFGNAARETILGSFDMHIVSRKYVQLYNAILSQQPIT